MITKIKIIKEVEMDKVIEGDYDTSFLSEVMVKKNV